MKYKEFAAKEKLEIVLLALLRRRHCGCFGNWSEEFRNYHYSHYGPYNFWRNSEREGYQSDRLER